MKACDTSQTMEKTGFFVLLIFDEILMLTVAIQQEQSINFQQETCPISNLVFTCNTLLTPIKKQAYTGTCILINVPGDYQGASHAFSILIGVFCPMISLNCSYIKSTYQIVEPDTMVFMFNAYKLSTCTCICVNLFSLHFNT